RVWKKVQGVDEEFVPVGSPADRDFTIENLPCDAVVEIAVTAVNRGGESRRSAAITVQLKTSPSVFCEDAHFEKATSEENARLAGEDTQ
ncbi:MAG: fibronectin type III domain-containing protein, partial [Limisphaerales bacterium]